MEEAVQYVLIELSLSPDMLNHLKTTIDDSGIIPVSGPGTDVCEGKKRIESVFTTFKYMGDTYYETTKNGILYKVHRYEYVSMRPYEV